MLFTIFAINEINSLDTSSSLGLIISKKIPIRFQFSSQKE